MHWQDAVDLSPVGLAMRKARLGQGVALILVIDRAGECTVNSPTREPRKARPDEHMGFLDWEPMQERIR